MLLLLEAAAIASGADRFARWLLMLVVGASSCSRSRRSVPLLLTAGCLAPDCGFEDFGAALPLLVSSSAFVLLAWLPAGVRERAELDRPSSRRAIVAGVGALGSRPPSGSRTSRARSTSSRRAS